MIQGDKGTERGQRRGGGGSWRDGVRGWERREMDKWRGRVRHSGDKGTEERRDRGTERGSHWRGWGRDRLMEAQK